MVSIADTGNADDTYLLKSAVQLLLEFPGEDALQLEIAWNGRRVRVDMPVVNTRFCPELEEKLAALLGAGHARVV